MPLSRIDAAAENGDGADRQLLMTALTTEHFTLQGARTATISESAARATLFVGALSSALVALGLLRGGRGFDVVSLAVLPVLYVLGTFTFVWLADTAVEDNIYGRAINRIRHHYHDLAGSTQNLFLLDANDDTAGVLANMGLVQTRWRVLSARAAVRRPVPVAHLRRRLRRNPRRAGVV